MVEFVFNLLIYVLNTVIFLFSSVLNLLLSVLPNSPFIGVVARTTGIEKYLGYLAWLLPIQEIIGIVVVWLSAMLLYYVYSVVMRWIKLID